MADAPAPPVPPIPPPPLYDPEDMVMELTGALNAELTDRNDNLGKRVIANAITRKQGRTIMALQKQVAELEGALAKYACMKEGVLDKLNPPIVPESPPAPLPDPPAAPEPLLVGLPEGTALPDAKA